MNEIKKHILIVEDEKPLSKALSLKLINSGFETSTAFDGEEALMKLSEGKFDLVLLDLMIPKKDGFTVLSEMRLRGDVTPVIVSTNLSQPIDESKTKELGAQGYIIKSDTSLVEIIKKISDFLKS